jgi:hypothetical protein
LYPSTSEQARRAGVHVGAARRCETSDLGLFEGQRGDPSRTRLQIEHLVDELRRDVEGQAA